MKRGFKGQANNYERLIMKAHEVMRQLESIIAEEGDDTFNVYVSGHGHNYEIAEISMDDELETGYIVVGLTI